MYLTAVIDWYSRYVCRGGLSKHAWRGRFCLEALDEALGEGPGRRSSNTDQGFPGSPARDYTDRLEEARDQGEPGMVRGAGVGQTCSWSGLWEERQIRRHIHQRTMS